MSFGVFRFGHWFGCKSNRLIVSWIILIAVPTRNQEKDIFWLEPQRNSSNGFTLEYEESGFWFFGSPMSQHGVNIIFAWFNMDPPVSV